MATASENLQIVVNMRGGKDAAAQSRQLAAALESVGMASGKVTINTQAMGQQTKRSSNAFLGAIKQTVAYGAAIGTLSAIGGAFATGFKFDATMEQNTIAFKHFLGSTQAAKTELDTLYEVAAKTPFQFSDITTAARRFLAFGFSVKQANDELSLIGDAIAGMGGGGEEINRMVTVLSQINAAGFLHGQDLMQLEQLGIVSRVGIAKQLGINVEQFNKAMANSKITSEQAITAINNIIRTQFKGSADEQSKTLLGQLSTAKDYGAQAAGALVQPLTDFAKSNVLPTLIAFFKQSGDYLKSGGASQIYDVLGKIGPLIVAATAAWLSYRTAIILVAAAEKAQALWRTVATLTAVVPLIWAAATGTGAWATAWVALTAAMDLNPIVIVLAAIIAAIGAVVLLFVKWKWFHHAVLDTLNAVWSVIKAIIKGISAAGNFLQHPLGKGGGQGPGGGIDPSGTSGLGWLSRKLGFMADGGTIPVGGAAVVGERGPELAQNTGKGTKITPMVGGGGQPLWIHLQSTLNGRVVSEEVVNTGLTAAARS